MSRGLMCGVSAHAAAFGLKVNWPAAVVPTTRGQPNCNGCDVPAVPLQERVSDSAAEAQEGKKNPHTSLYRCEDSISQHRILNILLTPLSLILT